MEGSILIPLLLCLICFDLVSAQKLKILGLHGYKENGAELCNSFHSWSPELQKLFKPTCISGPFKAADGGQDQFSWVEVDPKTGGWLKADEGVAYILDYIHDHGPFHGVFGFSMGGAMTALLAGVIDKGRSVLGRTTSDISLDFAIIHEGGFFQPTNGIGFDVFIPPVNLPSFQVIGNYDPLQGKQFEMTLNFVSPVVRDLNMGHGLLTGSVMDKFFINDLEYFLKLQNK